MRWLQSLSILVMMGVIVFMVGCGKRATVEGVPVPSSQTPDQHGVVCYSIHYNTLSCVKVK